MTWDDYELFLHVVRAGSIRAAARMSNTDHAAISRRLARLEAELGTKLLHRRSNGQTPTSAGRELMSAAEAMEAQVKLAERKLASGTTELEGWVRVSCNLPFGLKFLAPVVAPILGAAPQHRVSSRSPSRSASRISRAMKPTSPFGSGSPRPTP